MPYSLQRIDYEDDYKHRYDSGVYPQTIKLYKTYTEAYEVMYKDMKDEIEEYYNEYCEGEEPTEEKNSWMLPHKDFFICKYCEDWECNRFTLKDDVDIEEAGQVLRGEFVELRSEWLLEEVDYN